MDPVTDVPGDRLRSPVHPTIHATHQQAQCTKAQHLLPQIGRVHTVT